MRLDQFTKGQTAYILGDGNTVISKKEPVEVTVSKIGRKYVTVTTSGRLGQNRQIYAGAASGGQANPGRRAKRPEAVRKRREKENPKRLGF